MTTLLGRIRRAGERRLHPWRRARALARLRGRPGPVSVLVVCLGNICRSPFAAAVLERTGGAMITAAGSAGFIGPGRPVPPAGLEAARQLGIDLAAHRSRLLTPALLERADLVVVMEPAHAARLRHDYGWPSRNIVLLGDLDPGPVPGRRIIDPIDRSLAKYVEVYTRIERCTAELVRALAEPAPDHASSAGRGATVATPRAGTC